MFGRDLRARDFGRFYVVPRFDCAGIGVSFMTDQVFLSADVRTEAGKKIAKRLRCQGRLPAVVYGEREVPIACSVEQRALADLLHDHGRNAIIALTAGDTRQSTIVKDIQYHPLNGDILHVDFHRINLTRKIVVEVPIAVQGVPLGVRNDGGILEHMLHGLEVECLPTDIPDQVGVDVSKLEIGDSLHVSDLALDSDDLTIVTDGDRTVFAVVAPAIVAAEEEAEDEMVEEEMQEPEVIERGRRGGDDEEGDEA